MVSRRSTIGEHQGKPQQSAIYHYVGNWVGGQLAVKRSTGVAPKVNF